MADRTEEMQAVFEKDMYEQESTKKFGGPTSGNWGHKGVPGEHGGSAPGDQGSTGATPVKDLLKKVSGMVRETLVDRVDLQTQKISESEFLKKQANLQNQFKALGKQHGKLVDASVARKELVQGDRIVLVKNTGSKLGVVTGAPKFLEVKPGEFVTKIPVEDLVNGSKFNVELKIGSSSELYKLRTV